MLLTWLKSQDAVDAGAALADSYPNQAGGNSVGDFLRQATQDLRGRKLNFYQRARFANAFKWRLLEKGVAAATVRDLTQTLLISASSATAAAPAAPAGAPHPAAGSPPAKAKDRTSNGGPRDGKALDALFRQAEESFGRGQLDDAVAQYQEYLTARPRDTAGVNNLGVAFIKLGRLTEAEEQLRKAIARNPRNVDAHTNLGNVLLQLGRFDDAETSFRRVISLTPNDLAARSSLGIALVLTNRLDHAQTELEKVLKTTPEHAGALCGMGLLEQAKGNAAAAEALLWRALQVDPNLTRAWAGIASLRRMTKADSKWLQGAEKAAANPKSAPDEATLRFAIGKYLDDVGQYSQALTSFQRANTLLKPLAPAYDAQAYARFVDDMTTVYTQEAIASVQAGDSSPLRHVFVIGMPRSGVSLTEQILASHPEVTGLGALDFWQNMAQRDENRVRRKLLSDNTRKKLAADYVASVKRRNSAADAVVEGTPLNADYVGLIHSVLPDARFIYVRRDPVDTCLSCYFQPLTDARNYSFDLTDLAARYTEHARLIAHWRKVLPPGTLLEVSYEDIVANREPSTRKILDFLGLPLDERCLTLAVRGDSVGRARNYSKFVAPLNLLRPA